MQHRKPRGIAILMSLFVAVLVVMFVSAMVALLPRTADDAVNSREGKAALAAAHAGVDYAWTRLQANPTWIANNNNLWTVNTPTLKVIEHRGNVFGFLTGPNGELSQFRIRFNYQNGGGPIPGGVAALSPYVVKNPYVSLNNLSGTVSANVPKANIGGNYPVGAAVAYTTPFFSCSLQVEGVAGDGLRDATTANPYPNAGNRRIVSRVLQTTLSRPNLGNVDSAVEGYNFFANVSNFAVNSMTAAVPRLRTLTTGNVVANPNFSGGGNYLTPTNGKVIVGSSLPLNTAFATNNTINGTRKYEAPNSQYSNFLKMKWSDVPQANPVTDAQILAGTYVWRSNGDLDYFAQEFDGTNIPAGAPTQTFANGTASIVSSGPVSAVKLDGTTFTTEFTSNVFVQPNGAVKGVAIVPDPDITTTLKDRPKAVFNATTSAPILTSSGNMTIQGAVLGKGSLSAGNDINFQGPSVFETDTQKSVAIYAMRDVNLLKIPDAVAAELTSVNGTIQYNGHRARHHHGHHHAYGRTVGTINNYFGSLLGPFGLPPDGNDVILAGVVYAGHNFNTNLVNGTMYIRGMLVAYGGDADAGQNPGSNGGYINVVAQNAQVNYDPTFITQSMSTSAPTRLDMILFDDTNF